MKKLILFLLSTATGLMAQTATNPVFSPGGGTYTGSVTITISNSTSGSKFFCTTDGSTPDISSPQIGPTVVVMATTTLSCIAAVPGVQQSNMQAQNPISSYWKSPPDCDCTTTAACSVTTYNHSGPGCQTDDPGGTGIPVSTAWSTGITSPSLSGNSMEFSENSQAGAQTNVLYTVHTSYGGCDGCTQFLETHDYYWAAASNSSSDEDDMASFDNTSGIRYMAGAQYCHLGCPSGVAGWDFWGNSNVPWTYTGVTAGGTKGAWHHYQRYMYRIPAEESSRPCSASGSWPYIYIKFLAIDGTQYTNSGGPWKACANALPGGWGSVAFMQAQIDIASHSSSVGAQTYWDNTVFLATYPPSAVNAATYTIGAPTSHPQGQMSGNGGVLSGSGAVIQ